MARFHIFFMLATVMSNQRAAEQYVIDEYNKLKTRLREAALA